MKQNFIRTSDKETADQLLKLGFKKIDEKNGFYTFLNDKNMNFSENDEKMKLHYTNMLCV